MKKEHFQVKGMSCAACQAHVDKAVRNTSGVIDCNVNLLTNSMDVEYDEQKCSQEDIKKSVKKAGYQAIVTKSREQINEKNNSSLIKLIICLILMVVLMYVSMGHMVKLPVPSLFIEHKYAIWYFIIQFALTIPVCIIYNHYFINGFKRLFKSPNMDTLIALGASASLVYDIFAFVNVIIGINTNDMDLVSKYHHNVYFDSVVMILTLVSLGKYLEERAKRKTTKAIEALVDLSPKQARLDKNDTFVNVETIEVDDVIRVLAGEMVPVDGEIIEGEGSLEESTITGESIPVYKEKGDKVFASTILKSGVLKIRATKRGVDSSFNTIIRLVEEASSSKAPISRLVDKISLYFVPTILLIAIVTFTVHLIIALHFKDASAFEVSFNYGISVLVVACPCALGLATPVSIMVASGKGARLGLIIKNAEILEMAGKVDTVVMDKTGTITNGKPVLTDYIIKDDMELTFSVVNSIEYLSHHPLANAVNDFARENNIKKVEISDYSMIEGRGVVGTYNKVKYLIGNVSLVGSKKIPSDIMEMYNNAILSGKTALFIQKNNEVIGLLCIRDEIRRSSLDAIKKLNDMNVKTIMLTGDKKETASAIANELMISDVIAETLPIEKSDFILSLKNEGKVVAMVGDGVNDTLALTNANLGIAMGGGSDSALNNSDIVLIKKDLNGVVNAIRLSKRTMITIRIALFWAFFYNCVGVFLAAGCIPGVTLNPMICSIAMSFSSVFVVLTALSINLFKNK